MCWYGFVGVAVDEGGQGEREGRGRGGFKGAYDVQVDGIVGVVARAAQLVGIPFLALYYSNQGDSEGN